jgi:hypothetical protein
MKNATKLLLAAAAMAAANVALAQTAPNGTPVPLPEPGSLALLAAGVAGAVAALRNRRK